MSAINALNSVGYRYEKLDKKLFVRRLDPMSRKLIHKADHLRKHFSVMDDEDEEEEETRNEKDVLGNIQSFKELTETAEV
jgi:hypothetical protein